MLQQVVRERSTHMWTPTSGSAARHARMTKGIRRVSLIELHHPHCNAGETARNSYRAAASVGLPVRTGTGRVGRKGRGLSISYSGAVYTGKHGRRSA
jgi:hypothetical protein